MIPRLSKRTMCQIGLISRIFLGRTTAALHVSIEAMQPDVCELFVDAGGDVDDRMGT